MSKFPISETARSKLRATVAPIFPASRFIRLEQLQELDPFTVMFMLLTVRQVFSLENTFCSLSYMFYQIIM